MFLQTTGNPQRQSWQIFKRFFLFITHRAVITLGLGFSDAICVRLLVAKLKRSAVLAHGGGLEGGQSRCPIRAEIKTEEGKLDSQLLK